MLLCWVSLEGVAELLIDSAGMCHGWRWYALMIDIAQPSAFLTRTSCTCSMWVGGVAQEPAALLGLSNNGLFSQGMLQQWRPHLATYGPLTLQTDIVVALWLAALAVVPPGHDRSAGWLVLIGAPPLH